MAIYLGTNKVDMIGLQPGNQLGHMGNSRLIAEKTISFPLSDTNYSSLTISTTAQALTLPNQGYNSADGTSITFFRVGEDYDNNIIDRNNHNYVLIGEGKIEYKYTQPDNVMDNLIHGIKSGISKDYQYGGYSSINSTGTLNTTKVYGGTPTLTYAMLLYRKVDGTYATISNYGIYTTASPTFTYTTSGTKSYLNLQLSTINVRAHNSYFPIEAMNYIDPSKTILTFTWYLYEGDYNIYSRIYQTACNNAALQ